MEINMLGNLKKAGMMEKENLYGLMVIHTRVIGKMIKEQDLESKFSQTAQHMKATLPKENTKAKVSLQLKKEIDLRVIGSMI
jgi:hypothetical protein